MINLILPIVHLKRMITLAVTEILIFEEVSLKIEESRPQLRGDCWGCLCKYKQVFLGFLKGVTLFLCNFTPGPQKLKHGGQRILRVI